LIIGINKYKSQAIPELLGCVNDCNSIHNFLSASLRVPQSHIIVLTNEAATRQAIISNFENHLVQNSRIKKGDAIVFYYAGHGSRVQAPRGWLVGDNMIETICPCDEKMKDANNGVIHGIPDRTIDGLMRRLAFYKGDNIVRILYFYVMLANFLPSAVDCHI
jgi:Caspase domain